MEDVRSHKPVKVFAVPVGLDQAGVPREVGHDPHLDLRIVRGKEAFIALADHEDATDAPALFAPDGDVLQVGVVGRDTAGGCDILRIGGVDAAVLGDGLLQRLQHLAEFRGFPVRHQLDQEFVPGLFQEVLERCGVGGVTGLDLLRLGQLEFVEQHGLQLFG
ncbi:hypothetical protein D9M72_569440 [compost metagenome]